MDRACTVTQRAFIGLALVLVSGTSTAGPVTGDFGYTLGEAFEPKVAIGTTTRHGREAYRVKPTGGDADFVEHLVMITADGARIYKIVGRGPVRDEAGCNAGYAAMFMRLKERYGDKGYYAMDDSDMFYDGPRSVVLSCEADADGVQLVIEYTHDDLAASVQ